jgi:hypothetical protein
MYKQYCIRGMFITDPGADFFAIPDPAVWRIRDVYPGPDPGSRFLPIPDPGSRIPDLGFRIPHPGSKNINKREG